MNFLTKKIITLGVFGAILIAIIVFLDFKKGPPQLPPSNDLGLKVETSAADSKTIGGAISNPIDYSGKVKGLGFSQFTPPSYLSSPLTSLSKIFNHSYLLPLARKNLLPPSAQQANFLLDKSRKIVKQPRQNTLVFPDFYLSYLYKIQDTMLAEGFISEKKIFKTNEDVVAFFDQMVDFLIKTGTIPLSERQKLYEGIRLDLKELLKQKASAIRIRSIFDWVFGVIPAHAQCGEVIPPGGCYRSAFNAPSQYFVENFCPTKSDNAVLSIEKGYLTKIISLYLDFLSARNAKAQTFDLKITPSVAQKAGNFIGKQLGSGLVGGKLGKFIPKIIAGQIGNLVGSQLGNQLGKALADLFQTSPSQIDQQLRLQMEAELGKTGSLAETLTAQELKDLYGPTMGTEIDNMFLDEMNAEFDVPGQSSIFDDITKGLQDLIGDPGKLFGDLLRKNFPVVSAFEKFQAAQQIGQGGTNLRAPCCNCYTCTKVPAPIGCLNAVCLAGPAIWDPVSKACGCSAAGAQKALDEAEAKNFDISSVTGQTAGAGAVAGNSFNIGSVAKGILGNASLSPDGQNFEFYNNKGELMQTLSVNNVSNVNFDVTDASGFVYYSVAANQNGFNIYDVNGDLVNTVVPDNAVNAFKIFDKDGNLVSAMLDIGAINQKIESGQGGLWANGKGQEFFLLRSPQTAAWENPYGGFTPAGDNLYLGDGLTNAQENVVKNAVKEWKQAFEPEKIANLDIVALNTDGIKSFIASTYPELSPEEIKGIGKAFGFYLPYAGGTTLYLNTDLMANFAGEIIPAEVGGWGVSDSATGILEHETGHYLEKNVLTQKQRDAWLIEWQAANFCGKNCSFSLYSFTGGPHEAFAEGVNAVAKTGGDPTPFLVGHSPTEQQYILSQYNFIKNLGLMKLLK